MATYADIGTPGTVPTGTLPEDLEDYLLQFSEPYAGFYRFLGEQNLTGLDPVARYAQDQFNRYYNQWLSAAANDPGLGFYTFLQQSTNPTQEFYSQPTISRGVSTANVTPRARWVIPGVS